MGAGWQKTSWDTHIKCWKIKKGEYLSSAMNSTGFSCLSEINLEMLYRAISKLTRGVFTSVNKNLLLGYTFETTGCY